jgi:hypothetical protein
MYIFETQLLKEVSRKYFKKGKIKAMGDKNSSMSVLIPITEITNFIIK